MAFEGEGTMKRVIGYRSICGDGRHVLLSDCDGTRPEIKEIKEFQQEHNLSTAYLFRTGNGWHLVFLDKLPFMSCATLLSQMPWEDKKHSTIGAARGDWVLRLTRKGMNGAPSIYGVSPASSKRQKSNAHRLLLNKWHFRKTNWIPWDPTFDRTYLAPMASYTIQ